MTKRLVLLVFRAACFAALLLPLTAAGVRADSDDYKELLKEGVNEFAAGNWGEARALFRRAHELSPTARTYRGLALCDFELKHYVDAIDEFEASLRDQRRPLTAELRQQVQQTLERARQYVARYSLQVPDGVREIEVDGKKRALPQGGELLLDPGSHTVAVHPAGGSAITRSLSVEVGAREELALLPPSAAASAAPEARPEREPLLAESTPAAPAPAAVSGSRPRVFTWVAAGLTGAFGAGIVGFGLTARAKHSEYLQQWRDGKQPDPGLKSSGQTFETLTTVSIIGAAVSGAAAITLFIVEGQHTETEPPTAGQLQAGLTPGGAWLRGTF